MLARKIALETDELAALATKFPIGDTNPHVAALIVARTTFPDQSAERHANATVLAPNDVAGIDFFLRHNDQCELVRDIALRSDVERSSLVGQITNNAADRHLAEPDQSHVHNTAATSFSRFC